MYSTSCPLLIMFCEQVENNATSLQPIDVEEPRNWFTELTNNNVTKDSLNGRRSVSNGVAAPEISNKMKKPAITPRRQDRSFSKVDSKSQEGRPANISDLETQNRYIYPCYIFLFHVNFGLEGILKVIMWIWLFKMRQSTVYMGWSLIENKSLNVCFAVWNFNNQTFQCLENSVYL